MPNWYKLSKIYVGNQKVRPNLIKIATQWPCPDYFHVPTKDDFLDLISAMTALWLSWYTNYKTYLKLPPAWNRQFNSSNVYWQNSFGEYRTSTLSNSTVRRAYHYSPVTEEDDICEWMTTLWNSIRPFKNEPEVPDSSWTKLVWSWNAWIYHNSTLWLISVSSNWTKRYTIADKNLWAINVYNSWDGLNWQNSWYYYQRWNNYAFSFTWSVSKTTIQVDASAYWPWNYYSWSTFIYRSGSPYWWDTSWNKNLRWWESGNVPVR